MGHIAVTHPHLAASVEEERIEAARSRTREIVERLKSPGCVVDGSAAHTECDPCNMCEGVADWLECEYLSDSEEASS